VSPILFRYSFLGYERVVAGYGLMLALGILAGLGTVLLLARRRRLDAINTLIVGLVAIGAGLVGSYVLFVITILPQVVERPSLLLTGGLVFYGGPLAAAPAAWLAARRFGLAPLKIADIAAPALSLGHAFGRLGCFLGGCCYGGKWDGPWHVVFTSPIAPAATPPLPRHPVQLYESAFLLAISLATQLLWRRTGGDGRVALIYVAAYAVWRFVAETMRDDGVRGFLVPGLVSTSQAISLALVPAAGLAWWVLRRRATRAAATRRG
jgi:phosphatidylglycerol:prolipoprotein diacylglycerol transferase